MYLHLQSVLVQIYGMTTRWIHGESVGSYHELVLFLLFLSLPHCFCVCVRACVRYYSIYVNITCLPEL